MNSQPGARYGTQLPQRSSTLASPSELHRSPSSTSINGDAHLDSRSMPGHSSSPTDYSQLSPSSSLAASVQFSRFAYPQEQQQRSTSSHSDDTHTRSNHNQYSSHQHLQQQQQQPLSPVSVSVCAKCSNNVTGQFVRALGVVFHKDCFRCKDCNMPVAHKFFPVDTPEGNRYPLCETDYFRRLGLICASCGTALRGSYITACNKKFHTDHFTCSICPTLFGPQDSYYEHEDSVYCHFHYSTRFAHRCAGCDTAILKQFVEVNRNMREEAWHPECYMIHKFWNVKMSSNRRLSSHAAADSASESSKHGAQDEEEPWTEEERQDTAHSIKTKQNRMEEQVSKIWTILSAFEESSAACISDMLRHVSDSQYLEAIRNAERFILHVEVLFATIDDLEYIFTSLGVKGMSHVREARVLCKKTVDLFTLLQRPSKNQNQKGGMTQELLSLVTGLAHYLKVLIRIALTAALRLDREHAQNAAIPTFLESLHALVAQRGSVSGRRLKDDHGQHDHEVGGVAGTRGVKYGYRSLALEYAGDSPFWPPSPSGKPIPNAALSDACMGCDKTIEEDCVRLGTFQRWHSHCVRCNECGRVAAPPPQPPKPRTADEKEAGIRPSTIRRPPAPVGEFCFDLAPGEEPLVTTFDAAEGVVGKPKTIWCVPHRTQYSRMGLQPVTRLEQYAFLLNVALRRLYVLLKKPGLIPDVPPPPPPKEKHLRRESSDSYTALRSVHHLDRKLSATTRIPKRSTIIEGPVLDVAQTTILHQQRLNDETQQQPPSQQQTRLLQRQLSLRYADQQPPSSNSKLQPQNAPPSSLPQNPPQLQLLPVGSMFPGLSPMSSAGAQSATPASPGSGAAPPRSPIQNANTQDHGTDHSPVTPGQPASQDYQLSYLGANPDEADPAFSLADIPQLIESQQYRDSGRKLVAELNAFEFTVLKYTALWKLTRSQLKDYIDLDEMLEFLEMKKSGFWNKLLRGGDKKVKKKGVFCVPLELLVDREGTESVLGATPVPIRVPSFIDDIVSSMRAMDMSVEGIFRKNGNIRRMNQVIELLDRDPGSVELSTDNPVQLAALLKRFLRDLPDPLLTYKLHKLWIGTQTVADGRERHRLMHLVCLLLPRAHRDTMEVILVFLKWVASFSNVDEETGSKMDLNNLATVVAPSILKGGKGKDGVRDEHFPGIRVVTQLLEEQDQFFTVPEDFMPILHDQNLFSSSMDLPAKEFLKRIDSYMRINSQGRGPSGPPLPSPGINVNGGGRLIYDMNGRDPLLASPLTSRHQDYSDAQGRQIPGTPGIQYNAEYGMSNHQLQHIRDPYRGSSKSPGHLGMPPQPFASLTPPGSPRGSTDQPWGSPQLTGAGQRLGSQSSRPDSVIRPDAPSGPMSLPQARNLALGAI